MQPGKIIHKLLNLKSFLSKIELRPSKHYPNATARDFLDHIKLMAVTDRPQERAANLKAVTSVGMPNQKQRQAPLSPLPR
jgi:hypothetical protein